MKIELKRVVMPIPQNKRSIQFTADLCINGRYAGVVINTGEGGTSEFHEISPLGRKLTEEASEYCWKKGQEAERTNTEWEYGAKYFVDVLDTLALKIYNEKWLTRETYRSIVLSDGQGNYANLKMKRPISVILKDPVGIENLKSFIIQEVVPKLEEGVKILNKNLPGSITKLIPAKSLNKHPREIKPDAPGRRKKL